jgi:hypothetical protein
MNDVALLQGILVGLLVGAGVFGHALRLVTLDFHDPDDRARIAVASFAIGLYAVAAGLVLAGGPVGPMIAVGGPILGITAVVLSGGRVDMFQIVLGVPQVLAAVVAIVLLRGGP